MSVYYVSSTMLSAGNIKMINTWVLDKKWRVHLRSLEYYERDKCKNYIKDCSEIEFLKCSVNTDEKNPNPPKKSSWLPVISRLACTISILWMWTWPLRNLWTMSFYHHSPLSLSPHPPEGISLALHPHTTLWGFFLPLIL